MARLATAVVVHGLAGPVRYLPGEEPAEEHVALIRADSAWEGGKAPQVEEDNSESEGAQGAPSGDGGEAGAGGGSEDGSDPFEGITVDRLRAYAKDNDVNLGGAKDREAVVAALVEAGVTREAVEG